MQAKVALFIKEYRAGIKNLADPIKKIAEECLTETLSSLKIDENTSLSTNLLKNIVNEISSLIRQSQKPGAAQESCIQAVNHAKAVVEKELSKKQQSVQKIQKQQVVSVSAPSSGNIGFVPLYQAQAKQPAMEVFKDKNGKVMTDLTPIEANEDLDLVIEQNPLREQQLYAVAFDTTHALLACYLEKRHASLLLGDGKSLTGNTRAVTLINYLCNAGFVKSNEALCAAQILEMTVAALRVKNNNLISQPAAPIAANPKPAADPKYIKKF